MKEGLVLVFKAVGLVFYIFFVAVAMIVRYAWLWLFDRTRFEELRNDVERL